MPSLASLLRHTLVPLTSLAALAGVAAADDLPTGDVAFTTLGPDGQGSHVSLQLALQAIDGADEMIKRVDVGGQFMGRGNAGGYAALSLATIDEAGTISDLEVGGVYLIHSGNTDTALRAGLVLPTSSDDFDDAIVGIASTVLARPSDWVTSLPQTTSVRLAVAPTFRSGQVALRGDFGLDVPVATSEDGDVPEPVYHLDVGIGYDGGAFGATAELQTVGSTDADADGTLHVLALGFQGKRGQVRPFGTFSLPFASDDESLDGNYNVIGGVRFGF